MPDIRPIYSSKITKVYLAYLKRHYPDLDPLPILEYAGMKAYEVEDTNHWFTQQQVDSFHKSIVAATRDPDIARKAGQYATSTAGLGAAQQYLLGLLNLSTVYRLIGKVYQLFSRGASIRARKLGPNKIEIISVPGKNVHEKPYQCANRIGMFESVAKYFLKGYAHVEHPVCFHEGQAHCRYIISWERSRALILRQVRNLFLFNGMPVAIGLFFVLPFQTWSFVALAFGFAAMTVSFLPEYFGLREVSAILEKKGDEARTLIDEMGIRYDNAMLVRETGNAIASVLEVEKLIVAVLRIMKSYAGFDRGVIFLADRHKHKLQYAAGYGYENDKEAALQRVEFNLTNPGSKGEFVLAFRDQKPFLVDDVSKMERRLSQKSAQFVKDMGVRSLICVPIIYKGESLGILSVDNLESERPLTTSDVSLLMGVASQTAVGIMNAMSFEKMQESEKKYRELVENANSIIMRINVEGDITFFNEYAQRFFGYTTDQILGENVTNIFYPTEGPARNHFIRLIKDLTQFPEKTIFNESKSTLKNGETVWTAWTYKPVFDEQDKIIEILCIGNDITEQKRAELEKRDLENRLQRAHKMEAIGTLAGGVAHDLNNILSGIVSYPDLLLMGLPADSPMKKSILTIQKSGKRAAAIVQDLLTLARRGVITKEVVNLNLIIKEYLMSPEFSMIQDSCPEVKVKTDLGENILNMVGSPVHLSKTVMNLVTNALEATTEPGSVLISTENKYVDTLINGYDQVKDGDYVTLSVVDTGCGMPPHDLERIFEPFYTKKVMGKSGTGLGMAVVWGTVKDHSGYIDVQSSQGRGTSFTLYFPAVRQPLVDNTAIGESVDSLRGNGELILVVDDVQEQREIATEMLTLLGYQVTAVSSGEQAVEYLQAHSVDILILDMIMDGGMDGLDTYKKILRSRPAQKAIITSGYAETERVKEALALGAGVYLKKPYLIETIGKSVKVELNK